MATTQHWFEYNGASATESAIDVPNCNWKAVDDTATAYTASPVAAGQASMWKIQSLRFSNANGNPTANLSALSYTIGSSQGDDTLTNAPHWRIRALVSGTFSQPQGGATSLATVGSSTAVFLPVSGTGFPTGGGTWGGATYSGTGGSGGPFSSAAGTSTTLAGNANLYATALYTQLQTASTASPGPITAMTITATWTES